MFQRVVMPLELNEPFSEIKLRCQFVNQLNVKNIYLLHITSENDNTTRSKQQLDDIAMILKHLGFNVQTEVRGGQPATGICQTAKEKQSFIYIPGKRKNLLSATLLGSTTNDVLRLTTIPVLVHKARPALKDTIKNILYATDFKDAAQRALPYVKDLACAGGKLNVLHVGKRAADPFSEQHRRKNVMDKIKLLTKDLETHFSWVEGKEDVGTPSNYIAKYSEEIQADVIVLGRYNKGLTQKILGSTAERISGKVHSSILLIP